MKKLIAGKSLWLVNESGAVLRYSIVTSKYTTEGGVELTARGEDGAVKLNINRYGVVETDNRYDNDRPITEPPKFTWMRIFWSRRRAERAAKNGHGVKTWPMCEQSGIYFTASNNNWKLNVIPFHRRDVCGRAAKILDKIFATPPEPSEQPETIRIVRYDDRGLITTVRVEDAT